MIIKQIKLTISMDILNNIIYDEINIINYHLKIFTVLYLIICTRTA